MSCKKELDGNTLKVYRIDLKQFFEYAMEYILGQRENRELYYGTA